MATCRAAVNVEGFTTDGTIHFLVDIGDCEDSSGRFEYAYRVDERGVIRSYSKAAVWARTFNQSRAHVEEDLRLSSEEALLSVDVSSVSVECLCYVTHIASRDERTSGLGGAGPVVDPGTIEAVERLFTNTQSFQAGWRVQTIQEVKFLGGDARLFVENATSLPNKFEERTISFANCDENPKTFSRTIKVETRKSVSYDLTTTVSCSNEAKVGISLTAFEVIKLNGDLITKNAVEISKKETQQFSETVTVEYEEKFQIQPMTHHIYKYTAKKGLLSVPISGRIVIDALIVIVPPKPIHLPGATLISWTGYLSQEKLLPKPNQRVIDLQGKLINESYESLEIKHVTKPIASKQDPVCATSQDSGVPSPGDSEMETFAVYVSRDSN